MSRVLFLLGCCGENMYVSRLKVIIFKVVQSLVQSLSSILLAYEIWGTVPCAAQKGGGRNSVCKDRGCLETILCEGFEVGTSNHLPVRVMSVTCSRISKNEHKRLRATHVF